MDTSTQNECPRADGILSYMYGEMASSERPGFESHLSDCHVCTDEFAAVSEARFEVFDWKRVEFDELATPAIVIPYPEEAVSLGHRISGWLSWPTLVPAFALVLVAAFAGVAIWVFRTSPAPRVIARSVPVDVGNTPAAVEPVTAVPAIAEKKDTDLVRSGRVAAKPTKHVTSAPRAQYAKSDVSRIRLSSDVALNTQAPALRKLPRLGVYDDDNDTSLRLAQLLDETGPPEE